MVDGRTFYLAELWPKADDVADWRSVARVRQLYRKKAKWHVVGGVKAPRLDAVARKAQLARRIKVVEEARHARPLRKGRANTGEKDIKKLNNSCPKVHVYEV